MTSLLIRLIVVLGLLLPARGVLAQTADPSIPVLCYHVVSTAPKGRYELSLAKFRDQMAYLKRNGFTPLSIAQYYEIMTRQAAAPAKPILLTFDDNTADFATNVVPVLQEHGFTAVQFAVSGWVNRPGYLTSNQLGTLAAGYDIQNHTETHDDLSSLSHADAYGEVIHASDLIQAWTGKRPEFLAYPYGRSDAVAQNAVREAGIKMAFTVSGGKTGPGDNFLALNRYLIPSSETLSSFAKKVN